MPSKKVNTQIQDPSPPSSPETTLMPDDHHPDYVAGTVGEDGVEAFTATAGMPEPQPPLPLPPEPLPAPFPGPFPIRFCGPVSGRYRYVPIAAPVPNPPGGLPVLPINLLSITVRVDADRFYPQRRISIAASRLFPKTNAHVIAEITSDKCTGHNRRRIVASITYRDGNAALIPGDTVLFEASRSAGLNYDTYSITLSGAGIVPKKYALTFESKYFDPMEIEVDQVANAGGIVTSYDTGSHPNRPASMANETLSLATIYQRAGFEATLSPSTTIIPTTGAGANGTWSDGEMHNAMVTYWSRFANKPQWAMWVLYAARHDIGRNLGGVMFDDIGPNHRQGTAIFTDSFIKDVPAGDANPAAWQKRMEFWTAVHEMGHGFNLAHAWQKSLGAPEYPGTNPWVPLTNQPESRSFMNYPYNVAGKTPAFFADFAFRFSNEELLFMRHAPRRFVQMGNSNWFVNHAFEAPEPTEQSGRWALEIRPNREVNAYRFLEPVAMEFKLSNTSNQALAVDQHLLEDGAHVTVFVQREGGTTRQWRPMITSCHETHEEHLKPQASIFGSHLISASTDGWLIDEPGFYKVQAAINLGAEVVVSNVQRLYVAPPGSNEEVRLAPAYFTEDVARALAFKGAPALSAAMSTLEEVMNRCANNPAALHASLALATPQLRDYKHLEARSDRASLEIKSVKADVAGAEKAISAVLINEPHRAAETIGHIPYFGALEHLAEVMDGSGNAPRAKKILQASVTTMKQRNVLESVVQAVERKLARTK
jgi:hypothetical protein